MLTTLVTGANRGIGLELCRYLSQAGHQVIGVCRQSSADLQALDLTVIEGIDVGQPDCGADLSQALAQAKVTQLDWLINNAGAMQRTALNPLDFEAIENQMQINAYGPLRVTQACLPLLVSGSKIGIISSRMGSLADNSSGGHYGYRMSKAAINMAGVSLAVDLKAQGIAVALIHPGYVQTDMTQQQGHIRPDVSAQGIIERMQALSLENSGQFWHMNGQQLPW